MEDEPAAIDVSYTIEFYRNHACIGYPIGTPVESMLWLQTATSFRIFRTRWMSSGEVVQTDLTAGIKKLQRVWRRLREVRRRALRFVRAREIGWRREAPA